MENSENISFIEKIINEPVREKTEKELNEISKLIEPTRICIDISEKWVNKKRQKYGTERVEMIDGFILASLATYGAISKNDNINKVSKFIFFDPDLKFCLSEQNFRKSLKQIEKHFVNIGFLQKISIEKRKVQENFKTMAHLSNALTGNLELDPESSDAKFFRLVQRGNPQMLLNIDRITRTTEKTDLFFRMIFGFAWYLWNDCKTKEEKESNLGQTNIIKYNWFYARTHPEEFENCRVIEFDINEFSKMVKIKDTNGKRRKEVLINTIANYEGQKIPIKDENGLTHFVELYSNPEIYDNKFLIKLGEPFLATLPNFKNQFEFVNAKMFEINQNSEDWFLWTKLFFEYNKFDYKFKKDPVFIITENNIIDLYTKQTNKSTYKKNKQFYLKKIKYTMERFKELSFINEIIEINSKKYNEILNLQKEQRSNVWFYEETPISEKEKGFAVKFETKKAKLIEQKEN